MRKPGLVLALVGAVSLGLLTYPVSAGASSSADASSTSSAGKGPAIDCASSRDLCVEVADSDEVFGHYVGHDEPSLLFNSSQPGSGNQMRYSGILPKEPAPTNVPGKHSYDFQLFATFWFGMAICDTQSYPNTVRDCVPDSDANITRPGSPFHPGTAFMEVQFYPPGYVQQFDGFSCSAKQWCVAMTIDSLSENPLTGEDLNQSCQDKVGLEYVNFAYLTKSGESQGPANPVNFDPVASGKPMPGKTAFLNSGDHFTLTLHDTANGVQATVHDTTSGVVGSMTASAANGFGQVKFAPHGTSCTNLPYDFHPMYSTSSAKTTVPWAAATYNVAIDTEIGHFDYCTKVTGPFGTCIGKEGLGSNQEPADADDGYCFPASSSTLIKINGCLDSNVGYDGTSYLKNAWPDGSSLTPTPAIFTGPKTGSSYDQQYEQLAFNTDLPAIEQALTPTCDGDTGAHCTLRPPTDDGQPAEFYPYYSTLNALGGCAFTVGHDIPGVTLNDFGKLSQYGALLKVTYATPGGGTVSQYNDFQKVLPNNPCPAP